MVTTLHVGPVYPRIGENESALVDDEQDARTVAQDLARLPQDKFNQAWVLFGLARELKRRGGRNHAGKVNNASLGLGNNLLRKNQDIAIAQTVVRSAQCSQRHIR